MKRIAVLLTLVFLAACRGHTDETSSAEAKHAAELAQKRMLARIDDMTGDASLKLIDYYFNTLKHDPEPRLKQADDKPDFDIHFEPSEATGDPSKPRTPARLTLAIDLPIDDDGADSSLRYLLFIAASENPDHDAEEITGEVLGHPKVGKLTYDVARGRIK